MPTVFNIYLELPEVLVAPSILGYLVALAAQ